jgi:enolase
MIKDIIAREILDSRGNPTVECDLITDNGLFRSAVPSGASTGKYEAVELRDNDSQRYGGKGVLNAVKNINELIKPLVVGKDETQQKELDELMIKADGTENKSKFGANAILAVSMCVCRAGANAKKMNLCHWISELSGRQMSLPVPSFNIINGGVHAGNSLAMQEFMILPIGAPDFNEALRYGAEVYQTLKKLIKEKYGQGAVNVGDEGGFAPDINLAHQALDIITEAIDKAGYKGKVKIGMDVAASEFFCEGNKYDLDFKKKEKDLDCTMSGDMMIEMYKKLIEKYDIVSIEDPFDQDDFESYRKLTESVSVQIVGDDLLVTNPKRIKEAIDKKLVNSLLLKINQIGTISESIDALKMAKQAGWGVMVSHRSGETEDSFIADFVVGTGAGQIKSGAPCRSERLAKYNQILRIAQDYNGKLPYAGQNFRSI